MVIFISWSGDIAKEIAEALKDELLKVFGGVKGLEVFVSSQEFVSSQDIVAGTEWFTEISNAIENSKVGILCLTKENTTSESIADWIMFEAGALAFHLRNKKAVIPILFDTNIPNKSPLKIFEFIKFSSAQYKKMICDLNDKYMESKFEQNVIMDLASASYERLYPRVKEVVKRFVDAERIEVFPQGDMHISSRFEKKAGTRKCSIGCI